MKAGQPIYNYIGYREDLATEEKTKPEPNEKMQKFMSDQEKMDLKTTDEVITLKKER